MGDRKFLLPPKAYNSTLNTKLTGKKLAGSAAKPNLRSNEMIGSIEQRPKQTSDSKKNETKNDLLMEPALHCQTYLTIDQSKINTFQADVTNETF